MELVQVVNYPDLLKILVGNVKGYVTVKTTNITDTFRHVNNKGV